jgi:hypothetical protein
MVVRVALLSCLLTALAACKGDDSDGGTDTEASGTAGEFSAGPHGNVSQDDDGGPSSFTGSPDDGVDDGVDDNNDDNVPDDGDDGQADSSGSGGTMTDADTGTGESGSDSGDDGGNAGGPCCEEHDRPGCGGGPVEQCVCMEDEFCCATAWDVVCTVLVVTQGCGSCPGIGGDGPCCMPNRTPGCDDDAIEACVCRQDIACCTQAWDQLCVDAVARQSCGQCP